MMKLSCNAVDQIQCGPQCLFLAPPHRKSPSPASLVVLCRSSIKKKSWIAAVVSERGAVENGPTLGLAERLRQGELAEDGKSYRECFIVRSYEVGINKSATVETIANLLQEVGCNHAQVVGFSTDRFATDLSDKKSCI